MPRKPKALTEEQVKQIREAPSYGKVADTLGISQNRAKAIKQTSSLEEALRVAGNQDKTAPPKTPAPPKAPAKITTTLEGAEVVAFIPRKFEMHSILLWQAKEAAEREWNWPKMEPEDFLDTYLHESFKQRGIILGAYKVVEEGNDGSQRHLQRGRQLADS